MYTLLPIALFVEFINTEFSLSERNKWVTFGGSYPGMLAGWMRLKYPHLIHAAVSSSAPVRAIANFQGYNDVVAVSLGDVIVGGSVECVAEVKAAFAALGQQLLTQEGRTLSSQQFNLCGRYP